MSAHPSAKRMRPSGEAGEQEAGVDAEEEAIPCISMVAGPGDETSVLAVFWDRHSERLGEEGFMRHFTTREARELRLVCREFRETVDATAWNDLGTRIRGSLIDWRAAYPNAIAANVSNRSDHVDDDFAIFRGFHALDISIDHGEEPAITDAAFIHLRGIRKLFMRNCSQAAITDAIFANLRGIEELDMAGCNQAAVSVAGYEQLRGIETLNVDDTKHPLSAALHDDGLADALNAMRFLQDCDPMWMKATDRTERISPLHWASSRGFDAVALYLLNHGANANAAIDIGYSSLHYASVWNKEGAVRLLIAWGADINMRSKNGLTPIQLTGVSANMKALLRSFGATD